MRAHASAAASSTPDERPKAAWTETGEMLEARWIHTATLLHDGSVLVVGGERYSDSGHSALASAELYDPDTGTWTATGGMIGARSYHTATLLPDGTVLVAGGRTSIGSGDVILASAELYDPGSGSWTATGNMNVVRHGHTATLLPDGTVLVAGGDSGIGGSYDPLASAEVYDPTTESWSATGSMDGGRVGHTATLLPDGRVLVAGGYTTSSGSVLASAEVYDPGNGTWTVTRNMDAGHADHTATLLPDGKVLVAGGSGMSRDPLASAERYDPGSRSWTATGNMIAARWQQTATLLPDGTVLVAVGSSSSSGALLTSAELYDPGSGTWTATGNLDRARHGHTATLLPDGSRVLVAGGFGDPGLLASAELYDPGGGT